MHYFDSSGSSNKSIALKISQRFAGVIGIGENFRGARNTGSTLKRRYAPDCSFVHQKSPQQRNSYDCGRYTLAVIEALTAGEEPENVSG